MLMQWLCAIVSQKSDTREIPRHILAPGPFSVDWKTKIDTTASTTDIAYSTGQECFWPSIYISIWVRTQIPQDGENGQIVAFV